MFFLITINYTLHIWLIHKMIALHFRFRRTQAVFLQPNEREALKYHFLCSDEDSILAKISSWERDNIRFYLLFFPTLPKPLLTLVIHLSSLPP